MNAFHALVSCTFKYRIHVIGHSILHPFFSIWCLLIILFIYFSILLCSDVCLFICPYVIVVFLTLCFLFHFIWLICLVYHRVIYLITMSFYTMNFICFTIFISILQSACAVFVFTEMHSELKFQMFLLLT